MTRAPATCLVSLAIALPVLAACGSSVGGGGAGGAGGSGAGGGGAVPAVVSCVQTQTVESNGQTLMMRLCAEWTGISSLQLEAYRMGCGNVSAGGPDAGFTQQKTFVEGPCSHENALGACAVTLAGVTQTGWYYDDDTGLALADVQMLCAQVGGTFVSP